MDMDIEGQVLRLCRQLLPGINEASHSVLSKDERIVLGDDKVLFYNSDLLQLRKAYKSGSLDMKIKTEYSNARELCKERNVRKSNVVIKHYAPK